MSGLGPALHKTAGLLFAAAAAVAACSGGEASVSKGGGTSVAASGAGGGASAGCSGTLGTCGDKCVDTAVDPAHWSFTRLERRQYLGPVQPLVVVNSFMVRDHFEHYCRFPAERLNVFGENLFGRGQR